jgi:hypothetical protein
MPQGIKNHISVYLSFFGIIVESRIIFRLVNRIIFRSYKVFRRERMHKETQ